MLKFVGSYMMIAQTFFGDEINLKVATTEIVSLNSWIYPIPYILIIFCFMLIIIALTVIETDLKALLKDLEENVPAKEKTSIFNPWR